MKMINRLDNTPVSVKTWKGYTLNELRYHMAVNIIRREIEKERFKHGFEAMTQKNIMSIGDGNILKRVIGALNIMDYAVIAIKLWQKMRGIYNRYRN